MAKVAVTNVPTVVSPARQRKWFIVQNQSDTEIYISFAADAASLTPASGNNPGLKLKPDSMLSFDDIASADFSARRVNDAVIYAIHDGSGDKNLIIHEG